MKTKVWMLQSYLEGRTKKSWEIEGWKNLGKKGEMRSGVKGDGGEVQRVGKLIDSSKQTETKSS